MRTLAEIKAHLLVETDEVNDLLTGYAEAAHEYLASIGVDMIADPLPKPIAQAELMLIAYWFGQREAAATAAPEGGFTRRVPFAVDALIAPYRSWSP